MVLLTSRFTRNHLTYYNKIFIGAIIDGISFTGPFLIKQTYIVPNEQREKKLILVSVSREALDRLTTTLAFFFFFFFFLPSQKFLIVECIYFGV